MDFLNKTFAQLNDLFRSMTPGGRITTGLLLVVAVASVGYLFQHQISGGDVYLFSGVSISEPALQKMEEAFGKAQLNGFSIEGGRVKVPQAQRAAYLAALADARALPASFGDSLREAVQNNPFESPQQRKERVRQARQDEMSLVIGSMKGIERASVLVDEERSEGLGQSSLKTASVWVQTVNGLPLEEDQFDEIRYYITGANAGMKPGDVIINGNKWDDKYGSGLDNAYNRAQRNAERELNDKVRKALAYIIPSVTVTSTVTLDREISSHSTELKTDPKPVPVRTLESTVDSTKESASAGGAPGLPAQGGGANQPASVGASGKGSNETHNESKTEQTNVVSTTQTEKESFGLAPKLAKVSVGIPMSYFEKVWQGRNPVKEGEEPKKPDQAVLDPIVQEETLKVSKAVAILLPPAPNSRTRHRWSTSRPSRTSSPLRSQARR